MIKRIVERCKRFFSSLQSKPEPQVASASTVSQVSQVPKGGRARGGSILEMNSNTRNEIISSFFTSCLEFVKISMATLLSIFVPQYCADTETTCTLQQNFQDLSLFNEFVIAWNFITLGLFLWLTYLQNKREAYFISHLEEAQHLPYNSFDENLKSYPKIRNRVKHFNESLDHLTTATILFFTCNVLFSACLIYIYFYDGFRSITTLLANVLLVTSRLYSLVETCKQCRSVSNNSSKELALSTIKSIPKSYNDVDDAYRLEPRETRQYRIRIRVDKSSQSASLSKSSKSSRQRSRSMPSIA